MSLINIPKTAAQGIIFQANKVRDELGDVSASIANGKRHQNFVEYAKAGKTESLLSNQTLLKNINTFQRSNDNAINRLKTTENSIDQILDLGNDIAQLIASSRNPASGDFVPITETANSLLAEVKSNLNAKFNGKYIFAGSKTNTPPVGSLLVSNVSSGVENANYYNGDSAVTTVRSSETQNVSYGITAAESGFQKLIGSVNLLLEGSSEDDNDTLAQASEMVTDAIEAIITTQAIVKSSIDTIENINTTHEDSELLILENLQDISETDLVEATTLLSQLEAQVQATYLAFNKLSALQLTNFL